MMGIVGMAGKLQAPEEALSSTELIIITLAHKVGSIYIYIYDLFIYLNVTCFFVQNT